MSEWKPIEECPFQVVVEVRNPMMERPVLATRGYADDLGVHPDFTMCTSVYTPDRFFPFAAGKVVCPTEYRIPERGPSDD